MGYLKIGTPLEWEKLDKIKAVIRLYGLLQFIHIFKCNKNRVDTNIMFGDEIEYMIIKNNETTKESSLLLCTEDLIDAMMNLESNTEFLYGSYWTPEYASYIIEGTPSVPFKFDLDSCAFVEDCIRNRRSKLNDFLSSVNGVHAITLPCFPNVLLDNAYLRVQTKSTELLNGEMSTSERSSNVLPNNGLSLTDLSNAELSGRSVSIAANGTKEGYEEIDKVYCTAAKQEAKKSEQDEQEGCFSTQENVTFAKYVNQKKYKIGSLDSAEDIEEKERDTNGSYATKDIEIGKTKYVGSYSDGEVEGDGEGDGDGKGDDENRNSHFIMTKCTKLEENRTNSLIDPEYSGHRRKREYSLHGSCMREKMNRESAEEDIAEEEKKKKEKAEIAEEIEVEEEKKEKQDKQNANKSTEAANSTTEATEGAETKEGAGVEMRDQIEIDKISNEQNTVLKNNSFYGCKIFKPEKKTEYTKSCLVSDMIISSHPRYVTLTKNIRLRRGAKVIAFNPIYKDKYTDRLNAWADSLDEKDARIFKKKKKTYALDDHLIWNKSMTNKKKRPTEASEQKSIGKEGGEEGPMKLMEKVIKSSLFSNIDGEEEYIYTYDRHFIESYSMKTPNPIKNFIYLDAMCFGMGMCCQQVTMSCRTMKDARYLCDQLAVIAPLFLALTAATPYLRGFLADTDTRWRIISNSVDCRTEEEMCYLSKPRYSGISLYISNELPLKNNYFFYNDIDVVLDKYVYEHLRKENVDEFLARHIATLFVRDPLVVFEGTFNERDVDTMNRNMKNMRKTGEEKNDAFPYRYRSSQKEESTDWKGKSQKQNEKTVDSVTDSESEQEKETSRSRSPNTNRLIYQHMADLRDNFHDFDEYETSILSSNQHFENFQSTNWNSVRFKPPPVADNCFMDQSPIGWRVEFRTPDIQITDFENASVVTLIVLLSKLIIEERLNLYIPMTLLEENLYRSANRDALIKEKFYFRKDLNYNTGNNEVEEKSIYDIFFNKKNGIFQLCSDYLGKKVQQGIVNESAKLKIQEYIEFIKLRCSGQILTDAAYLRKFILNHPAYEQDSVINSKINYDVCNLITDIGKGLIIPSELFGVFVNPYKERIKSDLKQINESQYLKSLAFKFISGEDHTQYLLLSDLMKQNTNFKTDTVDTVYESSDDSKREFGKIIYQFSA